MLFLARCAPTDGNNVTTTAIKSRSISPTESRENHENEPTTLVESTPHILLPARDKATSKTESFPPSPILQEGQTYSDLTK
mmetsp:Transcript_11142/g.16260  ORF Transcript_11142/g.16260 Transcript_11142/m.16260 type:complete len:81 (+) Transcript_11142:168-410(+)